MERNRDPDHSSNSCTVIAAAQKKKNNNVEAEVALQLIKGERTHTVGRERESGGDEEGDTGEWNANCLYIDDKDDNYIF